MSTPRDEVEEIVIRAPGGGPPSVRDPSTGGVYTLIDGRFTITIDRGRETVLQSGQDPGRIGGTSDSVSIRPTAGTEKARADDARMRELEEVRGDVAFKLSAAVGAALALQEGTAIRIADPVLTNWATRQAMEKLLQQATANEVVEFKQAWSKMETPANDPWYTSRGQDPEQIRKEGAEIALRILLRWLTRFARVAGQWQWLIQMFAEWLLPSLFGEGALVLTPEGDYVWLPNVNPNWIAIPGAFIRTDFRHKPAPELEIWIDPASRPGRTKLPDTWQYPRLDPLGEEFLRPMVREIEERLFELAENQSEERGAGKLPDYDLKFKVWREHGYVKLAVQIDVQPALALDKLQQLRRSETKRKSMQLYIAGLAFTNRTWGKLSEIGDFGSVTLASFKYANGMEVKRWDQLYRDWESVHFDQRAFIVNLAWNQMGDMLGGVMGEAEKKAYLAAYGKEGGLANAYGTWSTRYRRFSSNLR